jgi:uncharacterized protein (TIGR00730 family)
MTNHPDTNPLPAKLTSVCLFCGSSEGKNPVHQETAARLGKLCADDDIRLVYGGGGIGLMGIAARAAMDAGGEVVGVLPESLEKLEVGLSEISELIIVNSMHARKKMMFDLSDAFIVLPGGVGTLDETIEMITWAQLRHHTKPIIIVDGNGYWQKFVELMDHVIDEGFAPPRTSDMYTVVSSIDEALPRIRTLIESA